MKSLNRRQWMWGVGGAVSAAALGGWPQVWPQLGGSATPAQSLRLFLGLSSILTGEQAANLDPGLALEYMERLEKKAPGVLNLLLRKFARLAQEAGGSEERLIELVGAEIWGPGCPQVEFGSAPEPTGPTECAQNLPVDTPTVLCNQQASPECCLARDIPLIWYTSALMEATNLDYPQTQFVYGSAQSYLGALAWKVAEAHPQAQCGGTYGYWASAPGEPHPTKG